MKTFSAFVLALLFCVASLAVAEEKKEIAPLQEWVSEVIIPPEEDVVIQSIAVRTDDGTIAIATYRNLGNSIMLGSARVFLRAPDGVIKDLELPALPDNQHRGWVDNLTFSPDGSVLYAATTGRDEAVLAWNVATGTRSEFAKKGYSHAEFALNPTCVGAGMGVVPSGSVSSTTDKAPTAILAVRNERQIVLWDANSRPIKSAVDFDGPPAAIKFAPDGSFVAVGIGTHGFTPKKNAPNVHIVRWNSAKQGWTSRGLLVPVQVYDVAVSPDSSRIAAGGVGNDVYILDVDSQSSQKAVELKGHAGWVDAIEYLPDGRLASGSRDGTVRIWDVAKQQCLAVLDQRTDAPTAVVDVVYGKELYAACYDDRHGGFVKRWKRVEN